MPWQLVSGREEESLEVARAVGSVIGGVEDRRSLRRRQVVAAHPRVAGQRCDLAPAQPLRNGQRDRPALRRGGDGVDRVAVAHAASQRVAPRIELRALAGERDPNLEQGRTRDHSRVVEEVADLTDAGALRDLDYDLARAVAVEGLEERPEEPEEEQ